MLIRKHELKGILALVAIALVSAFIFFALTGQLTRWFGWHLTLKQPITDKIVFVSDQNGHPDIWTMDPDGSNQKPLTNDSYVDSEPVVSPDGYSIVFISRRGSAYNELYAMDADGSHVHRISKITGSKSSPRFTSDSRYIIFLCAGAVWKVEAGADNPERVLPTHEMEGSVSSETRAPYVWAAMSADRQLLSAIQSSQDVQVAVSLGPKDETAKPMTDSSGRILNGERVNAAWNPLSDKLALTLTGRDGSGVLAVADLEDDSVNAVGPGVFGSPDWSPDGTLIALEKLKRSGAGQYDSEGLVVVDPDARSLDTLLKGEAANPKWSPDGSSLLYTSGGNIYSLDMATRQTSNLTKGKGMSSDPCWAPGKKTQ